MSEKNEGKLVTSKEVESKYDTMLSIAEQYDSCFAEKKDTTFGSRSLVVKKEATEKYWDARKKLEVQLAEWMKLLRKSIIDIPSSEKRFSPQTRTEMETQDTYIVREYENKDFGSLMDFFERLKNTVESYSGILVEITRNSKISRRLRDMRGDVLSFSNTLDLFVPEKMISIEKQVEITLKLRELNLEKVAEEIEGIDEEEDNLKKCVRARTALERIVSSYCEKWGITPAKAFHHNLDLAIKKGLTEKAQQKPISAHYSFVSRIVHKEIDANSKNTEFAVAGAINIIGSLIQSKPSKTEKIIRKARR